MLNNKRTEYSTIEDQTQHVEAGTCNTISDGNDEHQQRNQQSSTFSRPLMQIKTGAVLIAIIGAAALLFASTSTSTHSSETAAELPVVGIHGPAARDCTFDECYASNCDKETAPFTCEFHNGGPHGGCSSTPWTELTCDDQCDLTVCSSLPIPDTVESCKGAQCSTEWCTQGQLCGTDIPYQCTDGSARFGCSTNDLKWTLKSADVVCSSCCDVATC